MKNNRAINEQAAHWVALLCHSEYALGLCYTTEHQGPDYKETFSSTRLWKVESGMFWSGWNRIRQPRGPFEGGCETPCSRWSVQVLSFLPTSSMDNKMLNQDLKLSSAELHIGNLGASEWCSTAEPSKESRPSKFLFLVGDRRALGIETQVIDASWFATQTRKTCSCLFNLPLVYLRLSFQGDSTTDITSILQQKYFKQEQFRCAPGLELTISWPHGLTSNICPPVFFYGCIY